MRPHLGGSRGGQVATELSPPAFMVNRPVCATGNQKSSPGRLLPRPETRLIATQSENKQRFPDEDGPSFTRLYTTQALPPALSRHLLLLSPTLHPPGAAPAPQPLSLSFPQPGMLFPQISSWLTPCLCSGLRSKATFSQRLSWSASLGKHLLSQPCTSGPWSYCSSYRRLTYSAITYSLFIVCAPHQNIKAGIFIIAVSTA